MKLHSLMVIHVFEKNLPIISPAIIPFCGKRLTITDSGVVTDTNSGQSVPLYIGDDGRWKVNILAWDGQRDYDIAVLVALTYKGTNLPHIYINRLDVHFADGVITNCEADNLVWRFPPDRLLWLDDPAFAYIPGMTHYVISRDGILRNAKFDTELTPFYEKNYAKFKLVTDTRHITSIGRHRLICLAWIDYPNYVDDLVVNHIDGIPGKDTLGNLELVTRSVNNAHASRTGLTKLGRTVVVMNAATREEYVFSGCHNCAQHFGLNVATIKYRIASGYHRLWAGNLMFQYKKDFKPWVIPDVLTDIELNVGEALSVKVRNIHTGVVTEYPSVKEAARQTGNAVMTVHQQLRGATFRRPLHGFDFKYADEQSAWTEYSVQELIVFGVAKTGKHTAVVLVDIETGEETLCPTIQQAADITERGREMVQHGIRNKSVIAGRWKARSFEFTYTQPSESLV